MKFFEAVPDELFSPLASPNRALYADAREMDEFVRVAKLADE